MPTVLRIGPYEIIIFVHDHGPAHVHVFAQECEAIINLRGADGEPEVRRNYHFKRRGLKGAVTAVKQHRQLLEEMWRNIHGKI